MGFQHILFPNRIYSSGALWFFYNFFYFLKPLIKKSRIKYINFKETKKVKKFDIDKLNSTLKNRLNYLFELARIKSLNLKKIDNSEKNNIPKDRYPLW